MWSESVRYTVALVFAVVDVSTAEESIVNMEEFKMLCGFVRLTERINELLGKMEGTSGPNMDPLKKKVNEILFGTGISDVSKLTWNLYRDLDCGRGNGLAAAPAGKSLVKDLVCLCDGNDQKSTIKIICYAGNVKQTGSARWRNGEGHEKLWKTMQSKCDTGLREGMPTVAEFQEKKQLKERVRRYTDTSGREHHYIFGGGKDRGLHTCNGAATESDGICVMYPRGTDEDNASGIEWLSKLETLRSEVATVEERAYSNAHPQTKETSKKEKSDRSTPSKTEGPHTTARTDGSTQNERPNAQRNTTATTSDMTNNTKRPPEEQRSCTIVASRPVTLFLLSFI
uniref:Variant surface glycoprotein 1125.5273 n=1 Tax=Trypanosoma brucei TaxID=5691 RepID=A0A1J0RBW1_9TRYP|nr:variant surface glycoprotein 1125.5273 [Trypanosoma brucei]